MWSPLVTALVEAGDVQALNRARIQLQRLATPREVEEATRAAHLFPKHGADWVRSLHAYCTWPKDRIEVCVLIQPGSDGGS